MIIDELPVVGPWIDEKGALEHIKAWTGKNISAQTLGVYNSQSKSHWRVKACGEWWYSLDKLEIYFKGVK